MAMSKRVTANLAEAFATAVLVLFLIDALTWPAAAPEVTIGQSRFGNVFHPAEPLTVGVTSAAEQLHWSLTDFDGVEVLKGETVARGGRAQIEIPPPAVGYFELEIGMPGGAGKGSARTSFVVLPAAETLEATSPFGIVTHFAQGWDPAIIPLIGRAGIAHVRDEQYWAQVEQQRGTFTFPPRLTGYMEQIAANGLDPLIVLSFANPGYDHGVTPFTEDGRAGYARYGQAVLDRYGRQIQAVEIWNEYNGSFCKGPACDDRPLHYTRMLAKAYRGIKASHPEVIVAGGAAVTIPMPYLQSVFAAGGLSFMDVLVIHPYGSTPERVGSQIIEIRDLLARFGHPAMPIWITEFGQGRATPEGRREAANYLVRMATALLAAGVDRLYWYLLRDARKFTGMGLLRAPDSDFGPYAPAPAYAAYAHLIWQLRGATFVRREASDSRTHIYRFECAGREVRIAWTDDGAIPLRLRGKERLAILNVVGREVSSLEPGVEADVSLDTRPIYITGKVEQIIEIRSNQLLADSVADYSTQQGHAGWYYGYYYGDGPDERLIPAGDAKDDFHPLERITDQWSVKWGEHRFRWLSIGPGNAHPSRIAERPVWAVRRWISEVGGRVHVSGRIAIDNKKSDGVTARMLLDGRVVFAAELGGAERPRMTSYELEVELTYGSRLDFAIGAGPKGNIDFDSSIFTARITRDRP
jgi:hypothetical protein